MSNPAQARFVGRRRELAALEAAYAARSAQLLPVYGRRRVGKTELLRQFVEGRPAVFFSAAQKLRQSQLADFLRAAASHLGQSFLGELRTDSWETALRAVREAAPRDRKLVLVLDEFQWLCASAPELPSVLQRLWDEHWQRDARLMLVLCGSAIGFMEREVLGAKSPLFGRRTGQMRIEPLSFADAGGFFPRWSLEERARAWFVVGGVPAYLRQFDPGGSVAQNLARLVFQPDGYFQQEPAFLLREELAEPSYAFSILQAVGLGRQGQKEVADEVGLKPNALDRHLKALVALGYMERVQPLTPGQPSRKAVQYRVADPLLRFWFRYVEPHQHEIGRLEPARAFEQLVLPTWEAHCGDGFERLCREGLPAIYAREGVPGRIRVGDFWSRDVQIDVVGLRADGVADLGECKWGEGARVAEAVRELSAAASHYPAGRLRVRPLIFLRKPSRAKPPEGVKIYTLAEVCGE